jgi:hypothetical protein
MAEGLQQAASFLIVGIPLIAAVAARKLRRR